ncbi:unnamed protein product [Brassicogethes aeneus]|uniref:Uncharacterized protein n=1 Tax=Brassicogethes aeneus TaxID=1431903 RepID=A0A9P0BB88_BRAAE|nr:unnamed protein product [Brassicogethes aeneus]
MLLRVLLITVLIYLCQCRPLDSDADAKIVKYENDVRPDGYKFEYETDNGIRHKEEGTLKKVGEVVTFSVNGTYITVYPDQDLILKVTYVADENGYRPIVSFGDIKTTNRINSALIATLQGGLR